MVHAVTMNEAWVDSIRKTSSIGELLGMARKYVASLEPARIRALPIECRPGALLTSDDLSAYALALVRHRISMQSSPEAIDIEELGNFFAAAAVRLAEIIALSRGLSSSRAFLRPIEVDVDEP